MLSRGLVSSFRRAPGSRPFLCQKPISSLGIGGNFHFDRKVPVDVVLSNDPGENRYHPPSGFGVDANAIHNLISNSNGFLHHLNLMLSLHGFSLPLPPSILPRPSRVLQTEPGREGGVLREARAMRPGLSRGRRHYASTATAARKRERGKKLKRGTPLAATARRRSTQRTSTTRKSVHNPARIKTSKIAPPREGRKKKKRKTDPKIDDRHRMPALAAGEDPKNLRKCGQHNFKSGLCMGSYLDGTNCMEPNMATYVPYCKKCCDKGDPSIAAIPHPKFGKQLVTRRALPKGYIVALWGDVQTEEEMEDQDDEWGFETHDGMNINPVKYPGSVVQFSQCPGPHERISIRFATPYLHMEPHPAKGKKRKEKHAAMMFHLVDDVPKVKKGMNSFPETCLTMMYAGNEMKGGQLNMMYAGNEKETNGFFEERGLTRCDVWTPENPTFLKAGVKIKDLMREPPVAKSKREEIQVVKQSMKKPTTGWGALNMDDPIYKKYEVEKDVHDAPVKGTKKEASSKKDKAMAAMGKGMVMKSGAKAK